MAKTKKKKKWWWWWYWTVDFTLRQVCVYAPWWKYLHSLLVPYRDNIMLSWSKRIYIKPIWRPVLILKKKRNKPVCIGSRISLWWSLQLKRTPYEAHTIGYFNASASLENPISHIHTAYHKKQDSISFFFFFSSFLILTNIYLENFPVDNKCSL